MVRIAWIPSTTEELRGYGRVGKVLAHHLQRAGVELLGNCDTGWDWRVPMSGPRAWILGREGFCPDVVWQTMFEADPIPAGWVRILNRCQAIWVPCQWCAEVFAASGVTRPLHVSGYGVEPKVFRPRARDPRRDDSIYTFVWAGTQLGNEVLGDRKGGLLVIQAFRRLNLPGARLLLKARTDSFIHCVRDPRIQVRAENLTDEGYALALAEADCFVYPSHGEGFGLQPLEAMGLGLPVIAPQYSGMAEFVSEQTALVLPTRGTEPALPYRRIYGDERMGWAHFTLDDLCDRMQWAYEHREAAAQLGARAAEYARANWTWVQAGERGKALLERLSDSC